MNPLLITPLLDVARGVLARVLPDPQQQAAAQLELAKMAQTGELAQLAADTDLVKGQLAVNAAEAGRAGREFITWREAFGWVCVAVIGFKFIGGPLLFMGGQALGIPVTLPVVDASELWMPLLGMLGLGGFKTIEKVKGAT